MNSKDKQWHLMFLLEVYFVKGTKILLLKRHIALPTELIYMKVPSCAFRL